jgi:3'(2'), 5'-bisphosphate nucleotidase
LDYPLPQQKQPSRIDLLEIAERLEPILVQAGQAIAEIYHQPEHRIQTKHDQTPVTEADLASHDLLVAALSALTPSWPVVSEEDSQHHRSQSQFGSRLESAEAYWLIDPLDGTREFIARTGEFSINCGLVVGREAFFGMLYAPLQGTLYRGGQTLSAQRRLHAEKDWQVIRCRELPATGGIQISSRRSGPSPLHQAGMRHDHLGSALKFGRIAEATADLYIRRGPTMEWDTCAGQAIVQAAGGTVSCLDGNPLLYGKADWRNPGFIVRGRIAKDNARP